MNKKHNIVLFILFICTSIGCTCKARAAPVVRKLIYIVCETVNFGSPNLTILKKKFKNTTKFHNIFTISSFLGSEYIYFYFIWEKCYIHNIFKTNSKWQVIIGFKLITLLLLFSKHLFSVVVGHSRIFYYFISTCKKLILQYL